MLHPTSGMGEFLPLQRGRRSRITTPGQKRMANPAAGQEIAPREPHSSFLVNPTTKNWYGRYFHAGHIWLHSLHSMIKRMSALRCKRVQTTRHACWCAVPPRMGAELTAFVPEAKRAAIKGRKSGPVLQRLNVIKQGRTGQSVPPHRWRSSMVEFVDQLREFSSESTVTASNSITQR